MVAGVTAVQLINELEVDNVSAVEDGVQVDREDSEFNSAGGGDQVEHDVDSDAAGEEVGQVGQVVESRQHELAGRTGNVRLALGTHEAYSHPTSHYLEPRDPDNACSKCKAERWPGEPAGLCCNSGKVQLAAYDDPPPRTKDSLW